MVLLSKPLKVEMTSMVDPMIEEICAKLVKW